MTAARPDSLRARIRSANLVRVPAEDAQDMRTFIGNVRADLGAARESAEAVARLFPIWAPAMAALMAEIVALEAEVALYETCARGGLAPAPAPDPRAGLAAFEAASAGEPPGGVP
ncbi:MAG TPA: hypothetical protein VGZ72_16825 [Stellaceae bacterium]|jgi:hypothetical protein|nr:hypothetical protein [Stellaceae bacterium]